MKRKAKLICTIMLLICFVIGGCANQADGEKKIIKVGTNAEFPPFEYINDEGEVDGFDMAIMRAIGEEMGYEIEIVNMEFKSLAASLKTGALDAVAAGMTVTEERKQTVDFSNSYYGAVQSIVFRKDHAVSSLAELNGKRIAVQEGTTGDILVTPAEDNEVITDSSTEVKRFKKGADAIVELKNGGVDAVVIDSSPAHSFVAANQEDLTYLDLTDTEEFYAIAVGKGNQELLDDINEGLEIIQNNGVFDQIVDEYINGNTVKARQTSNNPIMQVIYDCKYVFIDTNGYQLLLQGLGVTIGISLAAVCLGIILGFVIALMKLTETRKKRKTVLSVIANIYINILRGTPVMVQLLIMYMIVFRSNMAYLAAILTFGINSGAYVAENIRAGIMAVDNGQMEGGRSLGFTYSQTMRYIILPQAIKNAFPALGNEFITLLKETSIVGYVAIQDLTKAADFIISRTYEAFYPLIAIAIIYFVLVWGLTQLLATVERRMRQSDLR